MSEASFAGDTDFSATHQAAGCRIPSINLNSFLKAKRGGLEFSIRRTSFFPPVFLLTDGESILGRIRMISPPRNIYAIDFDDRNSWIFHMPLFTVRFHGESERGTDFRVEMGPTEMEWSILIRPAIDDRLLVAALAFIHNERWHYS